MKKIIVLGIMCISFLTFGRNGSPYFDGESMKYSERMTTFSRSEVNEDIKDYSLKIKSFSKAESNEKTFSYSDILTGFSENQLNNENKNYAKIMENFTNYKNKTTG